MVLLLVLLRPVSLNSHTPHHNNDEDLSRASGWKEQVLNVGRCFAGVRGAVGTIEV